MSFKYDLSCRNLYSPREMFSLELSPNEMINPEDQIPLDDQESADKEDQISQQDIHSNGLEEERTPAPHDENANPDALAQAYRASESSYLLGEEPGSDVRFKRKRRDNTGD
jgi:hypothetical protein